MVEGYTKSGLENRVAKYYEDLYAETFPIGGAKRPVSIKDLDPMLLAFKHRIRGEGYSQALKDLNDIDPFLLTWGHYQRLVDMRTALEDEDVPSHLTKAERGQNLGRLGVTYLNMAHRQNTELFLSMAESIANDCKDKESAGLWLIYRAINFSISLDLQAAKKCLDIAKKKVKNNANKAFREGVEGWIYQGVLGYNEDMQSEKMLQCFNEAVRLYDEIPVSNRDLELRALRARGTYLGRARGYSVLGQHEAAKGDFDEARKELEALDNQRLLVYWRNIKGSADREMGKLAQAKNALEHAQRVSIAIGDRRGEQITNSLLGKVYRDAAWAIRIQEGEFSDAAVEHLHAAAHHCERALKGEHKLENKPRLVIALRRLGNVYQELHRASEDTKGAEKFLRLAEDNYNEAKEITGDGDQTFDARTTNYDWLERSRLGLAQVSQLTKKKDAKPYSFPGADSALAVPQILEDGRSPPVVPPVELTMGMVLLWDKDAYASEGHDLDSPEKAFSRAEELLDQALTNLSKDEMGLDDKAKDLKRRAEINYALGTALVGQAVSVDEAKRDGIGKRARDKYKEVLSEYTSPGIVRDTFQDLIAIREAIGPSNVVDECLALFRDQWSPEAL